MSRQASGTRTRQTTYRLRSSTAIKCWVDERVPVWHTKHGRDGCSLTIYSWRRWQSKMELKSSRAWSQYSSCSSHSSSGGANPSCKTWQKQQPLKIWHLSTRWLTDWHWGFNVRMHFVSDLKDWKGLLAFLFVFLNTDQLAVRQTLAERKIRRQKKKGKENPELNRNPESSCGSKNMKGPFISQSSAGSQWHRVGYPAIKFNSVWVTYVSNFKPTCIFTNINTNCQGMCSHNFLQCLPHCQSLSLNSYWPS